MQTSGILWAQMGLTCLEVQALVVNGDTKEKIQRIIEDRRKRLPEGVRGEIEVLIEQAI